MQKMAIGTTNKYKNLKKGKIKRKKEGKKGKKKERKRREGIKFP